MFHFILTNFTLKEISIDPEILFGILLPKRDGACSKNQPPRSRASWKLSPM